ncbi:MAG TPA: DUF2306 domain-containing protein [Terracidiphilus sp.]|jgi:uncharacterized membrane protein|nr:DUF2306 domain-containing protein [Terracidiphilus sp.]
MKNQSPAIKQSPSSPAATRWGKMALWIMAGAATLSVTFYSEVPLLRQARERAYLSTIPWLIVPHIAGGIIALLSGPLQFSNRLRRRHLQFHRLLGRVYVASVFVAAPLAILLANQHHDPRGRPFVAAIWFQAGIWLAATAAAFITVRNGHIQQHREWMVRSYALTFTFVTTRVLQPLPAWKDHGETGFAMQIVMITFLSIFIPDIAFHWRQLTTSRRHSPTVSFSAKDLPVEDLSIEGTSFTDARYPSPRTQTDRV